MADQFRDYWRRAGNLDALKAYGDGYADGRCFEGPISFEKGMLAGIAAYEGLMAMARVIGARERAKPMVLESGGGCHAQHPLYGRISCNLAAHDGPHKKIGRMGNVLYTWPRNA